MKSVLRDVIPIIAVPLPSSWKVLLFRRLLGWRIARTATIGFSYVAVSDLAMADRSRIGHLSVFRDVQLQIGRDSTIGNWNWISAARAFAAAPQRLASASLFSLGAHSAVTSRHYIDASGGVMIGSFTTIAGVRSTILSHQIDLKRSMQSVLPVTIGDYCFISSNVCIVPGAEIGNKVVVAMGSVVVGRLDDGAMYAGVPAKSVPGDIARGAYFQRRRGQVEVDRDRGTKADRTK